MAQNWRSIIRGLESIVGKEHVIYHPEDLLVFEYDGSIDKAIPQAVVFPASTEETSRVWPLPIGRAFRWSGGVRAPA